MSPRRTVNLIARLPQECVFKGLHMDGEKGVGWGEDQFFLALMLEQLLKLNHTTEVVNTDKKSRKPPEPKPLPIPGREKAKARENNTFATTLGSMFREAHRIPEHSEN